jgi:hypothetical protein
MAIEINKETTKIASVTLKAAEETSRITRVSVYLVLATTPFIITLQYFTSDRKLFPFERNARTFFVSVLVLMPVLFILALMLYGFDTYKARIFRKMYAGMGGRKKLPQSTFAGKLTIYDTCVLSAGQEANIDKSKLIVVIDFDLY